MVWDALTDDEKDVIRSVGTRKSYPVGACLFRHGDEPTFALIVLSGLVKLTRSAASGQGILIELRGPDHLLGELGVVSGQPRTATAVVVEPLEVIILSVGAFQELLRTRGSIAYAILEIVVGKLSQATDRRLEARASDVQARLCGRIVELAEGQHPDGDGVIELHSPLTQQELAEWIGVSRDAVVLALHNIREFGWIETGRRSIRILDLDSLRNASMQ